jgi:hypothetical protein
MRKLLVTVVLLAIVVAGLSVADIAIRHQVERDTAHRIEQRVPGSHATVVISSFPFLGRLAVSGTVPELRANVTGVSVGDLAFSDISLDVQQLRVQRSALLHGQVKVDSIREAVVHATVTQAAVDHALGVSVTLGQGTVGLDGVQAPATVSVSGNRIHVEVSPLPAFSIPIPLLAVLPCVSSASIVPGRLLLTCTTTTVPPALAGTAVTSALGA